MYWGVQIFVWNISDSLKTQYDSGEMVQSFSRIYKVEFSDLFYNISMLNVNLWFMYVPAQLYFYFMNTILLH